VFSNNGLNRLLAEEAKHPKQNGKEKAIPARLGGSSPIKHVFLIVKENRTYDQVLGDIGKGNGDPEDAQFGQTITPNSHALANTFGLFDNFYDSGSQSADGHQWIVQGNNNDYNEAWNQNEWSRSYPYNGGDPMTYQSDGFLWNAAERAHKSVVNYGEYEAFSEHAGHSWREWWQDAKVLEGKLSAPLDVPLNSYKFYSDVPSLNKISNQAFPDFDLESPDQFRVDLWEQDFKKAEGTGDLPNLTIMTFPDDHTGGAPTPIAEVADNDLAVGRLISDLSHSRFWKESAVFVEEDDSQAGVDHVDGHRSVLYVASPYAKRGVINDEYFTQINVTKTIEQILDIQPMNQMDRAAMPMFSAFTNKPNDTPYDTVHNQVPLTLGVKGAEAETAEEEREIAAADAAAKTADTTTDAARLAAVPKSAASAAGAWGTWMRTVAHPRLTGKHAAPDSVNPQQLNRYDWYTAHGWKKPYPGDKNILTPGEVPGRNWPVGYLGED
jgi:hypothetical protein